MPTLRRAVVFLGLLLALATPATAGPLEDAQAAHERGDYATELALLKPLAKRGDASAQSNLGVMYFNGRGVPQDYAQAAAWYLKAADQGDSRAQFSLGFMYANGQGVPQDNVQAHMWFNLAAAQGVEYAATNRDHAATLMTPEQVAEAQKLASDRIAAHPRP